MATKIVNFNVGMTCGGCAGAVNRILTKIPGAKTELKCFLTIDPSHIIANLTNFNSIIIVFK
jgi:copper chaperone CopZ